MERISAEEYKKLVLDILIKIDEICNENGIHYCLFYGSLLGAIRHGGFIPWDDDIDIVMLRKDYDALREVISKNNYGINFIDLKTNKKTIYSYGKVCDIRTLVSDKSFIDVEDYGAFVDVFPFDYLSEKELSRKATIKLCGFINRIRAISSRKKPTSDLSVKKKIRGWTAFTVGKLFSPYKMVELIDNISRKSNSQKTSLVGLVKSKNEVYDVSWIFPLKQVSFEGCQFWGPNDVDRCLREEYGDYMTLPPVENQIPHSVECYWKENI